MIAAIVFLLCFLSSVVQAGQPPKVITIPPVSRPAGSFAIPQFVIGGWEGFNVGLILPNDKTFVLGIVLELAQDSGCKTWQPLYSGAFSGGVATKGAPSFSIVTLKAPGAWCVKGTATQNATGSVGFTAQSIK